MMTNMRVTPRPLTPAERKALPGRAAERTHIKVRIPGTGKELPISGQVVPTTAYWMRRLADGSILEAPTTAPSSSSSAQPASSPTASSPTHRARRGNTKTTREE